MNEEGRDKWMGVGDFLKQTVNHLQPQLSEQEFSGKVKLDEYSRIVKLYSCKQ